MAIGDLRGRVIITNGASGTLGQVRRDLDGIANASRRISFGNFGSRLTNAVASLKHQLDRLNKMTGPAAGIAAGAGLSVRGIIESTRSFNEAKFGYGMAKLNDYRKDGKLDIQGWKADMDATANHVRDVAKKLGMVPTDVMVAREAVEKVGLRGAGESEALFEASLALKQSEPNKVATDKAVEFMNASYNAFKKEREKFAAKLGKSVDDPEVVRQWMSGFASRAVMAGLESALGPANLIEGARQYLPQWAQFGVDSSFGLATLAHHSNYGFNAPEIGTALKSQVNRIVRPTQGAAAAYSRLGIDRTKYMEMVPADPTRAARNLGSAIPGLYAGDRKFRGSLIKELAEAQRSGAIMSEQYRADLSARVAKRAGKGWEGRIGDIRRIVDNSILTTNGNVDLQSFIRDLAKSKATPADLAEIYEGRHYARMTPQQQEHYQRLHALYMKLAEVDFRFAEDIFKARKESEAGKTDALKGSWENLIITLEQSGGIIDKVKTSLTELNASLAGLSPEVLTGITGLVVAIGGIAAAAVAAGAVAKAAPVVKGAAKVGLSTTGIPAAAAGVGAATGWVLTRLGWLPSGIVGPPVGASGPIIGAAATARRVGLWGGVKAIAIGGGRLLIPGLGIVSAAAMGYGAYQGYKETGTVGGAVRGALGIGNAGASESGMPPIGEFIASGGSAGFTNDGQSQADALAAPFRNLDMAGLGARKAEEFTQAFRAGLAGAVEAAQQTAAGINAALSSATGPVKVPLNTGPTMSGSAQ